MNRWARVLVVGAAMTLGGCVTDGDGGYNGGYNHSSSYENSSPSVYNLNRRSRVALKHGCAERYGDGTRKYKACVQGHRHSDDALAAGCAKLYAGNGEKIRRCMNDG